MLLKDFYTISNLIQEESNGQSKITAELVINKSHHIFQGHFPGLPVVPGVCMVQIIKELVEQNVGKSLMLREAGNIKFLSMINPEMNRKVNITIAFMEIHGTIEVEGRLFFEEITFFKIKGTFITVD